ncbi:MAG: radical SAM protein [Cocleimonas sp.]|nr:radical SAM protein [Cocleimonas sp.]
MTKYYHVTVLSNWLLGFDKYCRRYNKTSILKSTYPNVFFVLPYDQLDIGLQKAQQLQDTLAFENNHLIVIETEINQQDVQANTITSTGLGYYVERNWITVDTLFYVKNDALIPTRIEEAMAASYALNGIEQSNYQMLKPRSISILPIARGCQARCSFCFSSSSISREKEQSKLNDKRVIRVLQVAKHAGAIRAVITGGGEPGLVPLPRLLNLLCECQHRFDEVVMISNGYFLVQQPKILAQLIGAGLTELSISRHHYDRSINARLMGLDIDSEKIATLAYKLQETFTHFFLRWVCVLQQGGIDSELGLTRYIDWAFEHNVTQICFKELYVASSSESLYFDTKANDWSYQHQVSLRLITDYAKAQQWALLFTLPWDSPIYQVTQGNKVMTIAAYTEPSVSWELSNGECRSWNLLADGRCYATLETLDSEIEIN